MKDPQEKEICFHVGLAKTGTTFLQYRVFPKMKGIRYIQRTKYNHAIRLIRKSRSPRILISNEFDQQFETEMKKFSTAFPRTQTIIVFRRQDSYIASQYRRFLKNGYRGTFRDFFDLEQDTGFFKKRDLTFMRYIGILEEDYQTAPIVLFYEDLRNDPERFIQNLANLMGADLDMRKINLKRKHTSHSEKQLRAVMRVGKYINLEKQSSCTRLILRFFCRLPRNLVRYPTLWIGGLIPDKYYNHEPLIPPGELEKIKEYYAEDWEACHAYASQHNKTGGSITTK